MITLFSVEFMACRQNVWKHASLFWGIQYPYSTPYAHWISSYLHNLHRSKYSGQRHNILLTTSHMYLMCRGNLVNIDITIYRCSATLMAPIWRDSCTRYCSLYCILRKCRCFSCSYRQQVNVAPNRAFYV